MRNFSQTSCMISQTFIVKFFTNIINYFTNFHCEIFHRQCEILHKPSLRIFSQTLCIISQIPISGNFDIVNFFTNFRQKTCLWNFSQFGARQRAAQNYIVKFVKSKIINTIKINSARDIITVHFINFFILTSSSIFILYHIGVINTTPIFHFFSLLLIGRRLIHR